MQRLDSVEIPEEFKRVYNSGESVENGLRFITGAEVEKEIPLTVTEKMELKLIKLEKSNMKYSTTTNSFTLICTISFVPKH